MKNSLMAMAGAGLLLTAGCGRSPSGRVTYVSSDSFEVYSNWDNTYHVKEENHGFKVGDEGKFSLGKVVSKTAKIEKIPYVVYDGENNTVTSYPWKEKIVTTKFRELKSYTPSEN